MRLTQLFALTALAAAPAFAAEPPKLSPVPDIPPPPGMVDTAPAPDITITQRGEDKVEEYRIKGQLYMIKVTPSHGKPYYLVDPKGNGQMVRYDDLAPNLMVPMWMLFEF
ncbi:uncharacterized protein DUF2782 [Sulfuritortus calidifontis]|uniref:Uncharacterized protein DUF2782 n=1 Tax=Sulfuritortus calidifontis TaxID=1914471 RepID=A0A4V2UQL0_9PROT|nr:DUF2782 domain-containing protein [Sulfuritortus calidifontis]TCS71287.1 uncharacterized protein DUF2782 [Sulfuritortus calidifontis]